MLDQTPQYASAVLISRRDRAAYSRTHTLAEVAGDETPVRLQLVRSYPASLKYGTLSVEGRQLRPRELSPLAVLLGPAIIAELTARLHQLSRVVDFGRMLPPTCGHRMLSTSRRRDYRLHLGAMLPPAGAQCYGARTASMQRPSCYSRTGAGTAAPACSPARPCRTSSRPAATARTPGTCQAPARALRHPASVLHPRGTVIPARTLRSVHVVQGLGRRLQGAHRGPAAGHELWDDGLVALAHARAQGDELRSGRSRGGALAGRRWRGRGRGPRDAGAAAGSPGAVSRARRAAGGAAGRRAAAHGAVGLPGRKKSRGGASGAVGERRRRWERAQTPAGVAGRAGRHRRSCGARKAPAGGRAAAGPPKVWKVRASTCFAGARAWIG